MSGEPVGRLIDGRYRLGEVLGTGGAAVVRRAHDERLQRDVAVKLFHPGSTDEERQSSEMALMASLAHPALVRMYDGGQTTDVNGGRSVYLVMEYVPGQTLHKRLDTGAMDPREVARIGTVLASALAYLHDQGVVHRDLKPANVLLPPDGEVAAKLGDFGVARMLDGVRVTATGVTVGTANYLSPEQARGEAVGPPSDVFSLGLVLLEALTGQIVYGGVGIAAAIARLNRPPTVPAALGPQWCELLTGMLAGDPDARPDAAQVRDDLARLERTASPLPEAAADAVTTALRVEGAAAAAALPAEGTVLSALGTHPAGASWPESYLVDEPRHRRRGMRPSAPFLLIGGCAAAIVVGLLASSISVSSSDPPAAPLNPTGASASSTRPAAATHVERVATQRGETSAPAGKVVAATRSTPTSTARPAARTKPASTTQARPAPATKPAPTTQAVPAPGTRPPTTTQVAPAPDSSSPAPSAPTPTQPAAKVAPPATRTSAPTTTVSPGSAAQRP